MESTWFVHRATVTGLPCRDPSERLYRPDGRGVHLSTGFNHDEAVAKNRAKVIGRVANNREP